MFACCSSRSCLGKRGNTVSECDLEVFFSQKCQTPAECVVNVFTAECKVWWYSTYTAMSAVVFQGHRSPLAFFMDILQYISIKYKDIIISFSYGDSPPHRSSYQPPPHCLPPSPLCLLLLHFSSPYLSCSASLSPTHCFCFSPLKMKLFLLREGQSISSLLMDVVYTP